MSRDMSASGVLGRIRSRSSRSERNENEFENPIISIPFPPPRTPLNSIPDPSQSPREIQEHDSDSRAKFESSHVYGTSDRKITALDYPLPLNKGIGNVGLNYRTPRASARGKAHSEPNSAQSTPARSVSKFSTGGALGACTSTRTPQYTGVSGGSSSKFSRGISILPSAPSTEVPHFELVEDPSFWMDHNVQVLIRIRPLSTTERALQGYGRCLRQESAQCLTWLGHPETRFTFDHVACETISQEKLFEVVGLPMVENCMSGYNSCMFAYGQTGSGKTYTMMGEIYEMDVKRNEDCGITPRIFEYLFKRIRAEEEIRRDEKLKYSCKCSFLEIYNEQITDLLEPSSTNLQLREDMQKGVYVENLTEHEVTTVSDVVKLLLQGAANRKMAATCMNSESSRSHSVFTCVIESRWDKDSMTHFRFGRLNLVDLAGSERQKSSGAEGERLKEAANINKSLSILGLVIMTLVDVAQGKHRHVPYRDSRLTFLLQDSLGGNSKTTIIANVSPSICSANETLSTLKFAQRAKLIQNNAKVNEDASGDVVALQREIQQLKGQLTFLLKHQNLSRSPSFCCPNFEKTKSGDFHEEYESSLEGRNHDDKNNTGVPKRKTKCMEATLVSALRREKMAEIAARRLEAEIEHMNRLVHQREEEAQCTKMMLRFRGEKIKRLESLADGLVSGDEYLMEENNALSEEIQLLQARLDRNPELTRFALENIRLLEQLRMFQDFYEQGERETLLAEVSELRDQLMETLEGNYGPLELLQRTEAQENDTLKELEECRKNLGASLEINAKLTREVDELRREMEKYLNCRTAAFHSVSDALSSDDDRIKQTDKYSLVDILSVRSDSEYESASYIQVEDEFVKRQNDQKMSDVVMLQPSTSQKELSDARFLIEVMECEQARLIEELDILRQENCLHMELLKDKDKNSRDIQSSPKLESHCQLSESYHKTGNLGRQDTGVVIEGRSGFPGLALQEKFDKMQRDLEEARKLNRRYQDDQASQLRHQHEVEQIREQVEMETAKTILHLQEELATLQQELQERFCFLSQENTRLRSNVASQEDKIRALSEEWEKATLDLTNFLVDGCMSLEDASTQVESISISFPQIISEHVERAAKVFVEKEKTIFQLRKNLEEAQQMGLEMKLKLSSLKGATLAITEVQQLENDENAKEVSQLRTLLSEKISMVDKLKSKLKEKEGQIIAAVKRADAAFVLVKRLLDFPKDTQLKVNEKESHDLTMSIPSGRDECSILEMKDEANTQAVEATEVQVEMARRRIGESENASSIDSFLPNSGLSTTNIVQLDKLDESLPSNFSCVCPGELTEQKWDLLSERDSTFTLGDMKLGKFQKSNKNFVCNDATMQSLRRKELQIAFNNFLELHVGMAPLYNDEEMENCSYAQGKFFRESVAFGNNNRLNMDYKGPNKLPVLEMGQDLQSSEVRMAKAEASCSKTREILNLNLHDANLVVDERINRATSFLNKFEEAEATLKEADAMLNALLKANENSKEMTDKWKQAGRELMIERASLVEEVQQLKASIFLKEGEYEFMQNQICSSLVEIASSISLLEGSFLQMKRDVEEWFKVIYSDIFSLGQDILDCICSSRSSLEEIWSNVMENGFALFVLYQCHVGKYFENTSRFNVDLGFAQYRQKEYYPTLNNLETKCMNAKEDDTIIQGMFHKKGIQEEDQSEHPQKELFYPVDILDHKYSFGIAAELKEIEQGQSCDNMVYENLSLKRELSRKDVLLKGLLFDLSLLQESTANAKDIKTEIEQMSAALTLVRHELTVKTTMLDDIKIQHGKLKAELDDRETALSISNSELGQAKGMIDTLSNQNTEMRLLIEDLYTKNCNAEKQLDEKNEVVKGLEKEILLMASSVEEKILCSIEDIMDDLRRVTGERDHLHEEVVSLNDKLEMANALAEENEAIAIEARQESQASKIYAEQKEEEVKILERSVEELERTIDVLEKKVYEMGEEVERHHLMRDDLEVELQALRRRMLTVETVAENMDYEDSNVEHQEEDQTSKQKNIRTLEHCKAENRIRFLEKERAEQTEEIKRCREYISELVLHAEAQASQYQQKYKTLEAMVREVKTDPSTSTCAASLLDRNDKSSTRTRGSSSPFRCIASLVQQMNLEKDQELSMAKHRIEELEALAANRQKEVCTLNARLAAAENMTHDVIRDLLGVKLDMTNYANLIDQHQVQKLLEEAYQQTEESLAKEQEILKLREKINNLIEERESCIEEINQREADVLAAQVTVEQLRQRDQLLSAQNEMLQMEKTNLKRKIIELDEMVKKVVGPQSMQQQIQQPAKMKEHNLGRVGNKELSKRLAHSERLLSRVNDELALYCTSDGRDSRNRTSEQRFRLKIQEPEDGV